jgi:FtsP/CotA-like multicopper oxidase with cupredoxin domain
MTKYKSNKFSAGLTRLFSLTAMLLLLAPVAAHAAINGIDNLGSDPTFDLTAREGYVSAPDGASIYSWGYAYNNGLMQLPGPTLIVRENEEVTINLQNALPAAAGNVSIVFPGHQVTTTVANPGVPGDLTQEAQTGGSVSYTFTAGEPGTYQYHSGTRPDLQVEMGLYGALIVRPSDFRQGNMGNHPFRNAYNHPETNYDREFLFLMSEMDLDIHQAVESQVSGPGPIEIGFGPFKPEYWFINGRAAPDTLAAPGSDVLVYQPYDALAIMHPGDRVLMRVVGAGRDPHPLHPHGNHVRVLARDGRLLVAEADPATKLAGPAIYTISSVPGGTIDAIFEWTGKNLGWDMYGHEAGGACFDQVDNRTGLPTASTHPYTPGDGYADADVGGVYLWEWCADHGKPLPVELPALSALAFGGFYSGSPFLGQLDSLPPGEGGLNPWGAFTYVWHSHSESELLNNDLFPGGILTIMAIISRQYAGIIED